MTVTPTIHPPSCGPAAEPSGVAPSATSDDHGKDEERPRLVIGSEWRPISLKPLSDNWRIIVEARIDRAAAGIRRITVGK
jgi:hypothetical protein